MIAGSARTSGLTLARRFHEVRGVTEELAAPLSAEDQTVQSMPDVSPTKWHRAHTTWFFEAFLLGPGLPGYREFHPDFAYLFNSYYEGMGERHPRAQRGLLSRPGVGEIAAYRDHVDEAMGRLVEGLDPAGPEVGLVELGLHHEQQHQELLAMDIKHVLSVNPLLPAYRDRSTGTRSVPRPLGWLERDAGVARIGHAGDGFAFDNEAPRHRVFLEPFALADRPVTCGEFETFVDDGGYRRADLWLSDGWAAVRAEGWTQPLYWLGDPGDRRVFTLHGPEPLDPAQPVCHLSYYEADAYARWAGARLPTEAEWEVVAGSAPAPGTDAHTFHPALGAAADDPLGVGQVWEWTASAYLPYPGFEPAAGAVGEYNGKFMVNQHVLRGGCCATPAGHARATYRNFFPPSARWAFAGARLARDL